MSERTEAKLRAKNAIRGMTIALWAVTFLVSLPVSVVSGLSGSVESLLTTVFNQPKDGVVVSVASALFSLLLVAASIFTIPLSVGLQRKYLHVARGGASNERSALDAYRNKEIAEPIKGQLLAGIYVFLWSLLCVIPGIVVALKYSMLTLVFADNPGIDYRSAMEKCKEITKGRKGKIFAFYLSYLGWYILVGLTFGILSLYVIPYENTAFAALYDIWNPARPTPEADEREDGSGFGEFPEFDLKANTDDYIRY